jgi:carboxylesterase type B
LYILPGATAQGVVSVDNKEFMDWTDKNKYEAHVESKLGSFNVTIPGQAMSLYNMTDHWQEYSTMLSDIRTVCPIQELADYVSKNFVADVFSYVATQKKTSSSESNGGLGGIAEKTIDISAIFGTYKPKEVADNTQELDFIRNMQNLFYTFVKTGKLPMDKDLTLGMYIVDDKIVTQRNYPKCDFWKKAQNIVPTYANLN